VVEALKGIVNFLTAPAILITLAAVAFFLAMRSRTVWKPRVALAAAVAGTIFLAVSVFDANFVLIVKKPDNIPIVAMLFLVGFFVWLAMSQALANDDRIARGEPVAEVSDGESEKTSVWPNLVYSEMLSMILVTVVLIVWAIAFKAPIEEPANPARTPNPSKAPWYFLGLQEMLVYFDPWLAGVVFPSLIIVGLMAIPYIDKNPKGGGYYSFKERRFEITTFLFGFLILWVLLLVLGTFLRGPNWNFFGPYEFWDIHKLEALVNVNLSEYFWVRLLNRKMPSMFVRELPGMLLVFLYIGVLPVLLATRDPLLAIPLGRRRSVTVIPGLRKFYRGLGAVRYSVFVVLLLSMMALPIKMVLRWLFNLKYIVAMPEIFFNI
jgi:hypothetical protein